jgi:hypothetical protein
LQALLLRLHDAFPEGVQYQCALQVHHHQQQQQQQQQQQAGFACRLHPSIDLHLLLSWTDKQHLHCQQQKQ